jgi:SAM-dependent methyltransferase
MTDDTLLTEQLDYYRARAGEYDTWWLRQGRFDHGAEANAQWFAETAELERALKRFAPAGDVLELAGGTGLWTRHLVRYATSLTVVDGAPEVLAINRERVGDPAVRFLNADLFAFDPEPGAYDACFFSFWLSHVPAERFAAFWQMVATALAPNGRVMFVDSARTERSTAADHQLPGQGEQMMTRRLDDGREFQIVKRFFDPEPLQDELATLGWECRVQTTGEFFIYGTASLTARP